MKWMWVAVLLHLFFGGMGCRPEITEQPLTLPMAAEPSSKLHNDMGLEYFGKHEFKEAVIHFLQAKTADPHAGEIHFNIGLCRHLMGEKDKARGSFKLARQYARANPRILKSKLLTEYLGSKE